MPEFPHESARCLDGCVAQLLLYHGHYGGGEPWLAETYLDEQPPQAPAAVC